MVTKMPLGEALTLRDLVREAVDQTIPILAGKTKRFLEFYATGMPIAQIAREISMSRPHLSGVYRPKVAAAVTESFIRIVSEAPTDS